MNEQIDWVSRASEVKALLDSNNDGQGFGSFDNYQWHKDEYWRCLAQAKKTTSGKLNPVGFWHPTMSN